MGESSLSNSEAPEVGSNTSEEDQCVLALAQSIGNPFTDGNEIEVLQNGDAIFPAMLSAIEQAQVDVEFATFVYWRGEIAQRFASAFCSAVGRGARVRVLLDAFGAYQMSKQLLDQMRDAGVEVRWFRPLTWRFWRLDKRMHRKLLICDSSVGFTGGVGIAEEWEGDARNPSEWRDTHIELRGPAVESLRAAFLDSWNGSGRWSFQAPSTQPASLTGGCPVQVVRSSATVGWTDSATMVRTLIAIAEHTLDIVTAYFHPDERLQELLVEARQRGVRVRVLVPGKYTDSRACQIAGFQAVERLVSAGIDIFFYHRTMLHAKWAAADGRIACIGSANFNYRSMYKDEECCVVAVSNDVVAALESGLENDLRHSERVELTRWRNRARYKKGLEHIVRIVREQL